MDVYTTEEQQVEAIKKWWKENGTQILIGIAVGLVLVFGWRQYSAYELSSSEQRAEAYAEVRAELDKGAPGIAPAKQFIEQDGGSNYGLMAAMAVAKLAVEQKDFTEAAAQLSWILSKVDSKHTFYPIAVVRLARVQYQSEQYDAALNTLNKELPQAYKAQAEELKGDIYLAQQQSELARQAYQAAADAGGLAGNPLLKQKLDDLAVAVATE